MSTSDGPYQTEAQARERRAVRDIYDAARASTRRGVMAEENHHMLQQTCAAAGVELGGYDRRILSCVASLKPQICAVTAGLITCSSRSSQLASAGQAEAGPNASPAADHPHRP
jgi:hypothetical protein